MSDVSICTALSKRGGILDSINLLKQIIRVPLAELEIHSLALVIWSFYDHFFLNDTSNLLLLGHTFNIDRELAKPI